MLRSKARRGWVGAGTLVVALASGCGPVDEPAAAPVENSPAPSPTPAEAQAEPADGAVGGFVTPEPAAVVAATDRDEKDRESDLRRKPAELLTFMKLGAGMKVADIGAGTGYTTELLARMVGPEGKVYGHNAPFVLERFARAGWDARLEKAVNANVVSVERAFDDPFPADIEPLDRVVNVLFFHDFEWQGVDRAAHLAGVYAALRPGGTYVIVDASAAAGHGAADSKSLHRVEEALVIRECEAAGFVLGERGEFLRNPDDTRDWIATPWGDPERAARGEFSDKFVLEFRKPE